MLNVLIACEESQTVCKAFRELGHNAFSCDLQDCSGGRPEWHIKGDALEAIRGGQFVTADGAEHYVEKWDLLIAHPPCTYLSNAGACRLYTHAGQIDPVRYQKGLDGKEFFMKFYNSDCEHIVIENHVPTKIWGLPEKSQMIQPYMFGDPWKKKTYLWIKGLPNLEPTDIVEPVNGSWVQGQGSAYRKAKENGVKMPMGHRSQKLRSKTFPGIARAMAEQWSAELEKGCNNG